MEIFDDGGPIVRLTIGPSEFTFHKLSPSDRRKLVAKVRAERRANLKDNLKASGTSPAEFFAELDAFDQAIFGERFFLALMSDSQYRVDILEAGFTKVAGQNFPFDMVALGYDDELAVAACLCGIKLTIPEAPVSDGNGDQKFADAPAEVRQDRPSDAG